MFKTIGSREVVKADNKFISLLRTIKNVPNKIKDSFTGIVWPDKERVKKEFLIVLGVSVVVTLILFGISSGTAFLLKLFF